VSAVRFRPQPHLLMQSNRWLGRMRLRLCHRLLPRRRPDRYRRISLGQIQLKLNSNEKGTLKFEVHNRIGWMLRGISINMH